MNAVRSKIAEIVDREELPGTSSRIVAEGTFLPFVESPGNRALFECYAAAAAEIGFKVEGEFSGGSADSGFTSSAGVPTLCATGPVGGKPHTADEYLVLSSLVPRAKALALTIMRIRV
jgi:glutamate carboxypeptidase